MNPSYKTKSPKGVISDLVVVLVAKSCLTLVIPGTVACQAPLSMGFFFFFFSWDSSGKNTGVGCHFLLQGIFLTQESNLHLLLGRQVFYHQANWEAHTMKYY